MDSILALETAWDGFFERLRDREYSETEAEEVIHTIRSVRCEGETLPKRLVSLLWFIPIFVDWNKDRCIENGADKESYVKFLNRVTEVIIEKLGVP